ncbi:hypothetical protein RRG08_021333 [Elysia crispata]|uniref:Uncharacterized protein n=1 Tax=Elysia crispata TaxID=231223 RepID=A0AAE1AZ43_9GAST|nr:hypothetical protein RRG08_021333 [Elysia crispata]
MKIAVLLVFTVAVTLVNGATLEKRGFRDIFRNITAIGRDALSDLLDLASRGWKNLRQRIKDYDIKGRLVALRDRLKARYGHIVDRVSDINLENIAKAAKNIMKDAADVLDVDQIVGQVRSALGKDVDDLSDDDIGKIVKGVEDDITADDSKDDTDSGMRKRGLFDDIRSSFRNLTAIGRDTFSDLFGLANRGWKNLKQRIKDYDIRGRIANLRQKVRDRYGDVIEDVSSLKFQHIVDAAKVIIEDASDILDVNKIVSQIRSALGADVKDIRDNQIADIVKVVEDDVDYDPTVDDVDHGVNDNPPGF